MCAHLLVLRASEFTGKLKEQISIINFSTSLQTYFQDLLCEWTQFGTPNPQYKVLRNTTWTWFSYSEECVYKGKFMLEIFLKVRKLWSREGRVGWVFRRNSLSLLQWDLMSKSTAELTLLLPACLRVEKQVITKPQITVTITLSIGGKGGWGLRGHVYGRAHTYTHTHTVYTLEGMHIPSGISTDSVQFPA